MALLLRGPKMDAIRIHNASGEVPGGVMATLTIKNVPERLYEQLKARARRQRRSINQEAIVCIEQVVGLHYDDEEELQEEIRSLREQSGIYVTLEEIKAAIDEGRD